jgi:hypothetical protein
MARRRVWEALLHGVQSPRSYNIIIMTKCIACAIFEQQELYISQSLDGKKK